MSLQTLPTEGRETQTLQNSPEQALKDAHKAFYGLLSSEGFTAFTAASGLSIDDYAKPTYWEAVADYAHNATLTALDEGEASKEVFLQELFAATPDFVFNSMALSRGRSGFPTTEAFRAAKERVSYYNGLIRHIPQTWPDTRASALTESLIKVANNSIERPDIKRASLEQIHSTIRGAQHEVAFGQLLEHTGRKFRKAGVEEDLLGVDYAVERSDTSEELIDVKASQGAVTMRGSNLKPYIRGMNGQLTIQSLLTDQELGDHFFVSERVAMQRAEALNRLLEIAGTPGEQMVWSS